MIIYRGGTGTLEYYFFYKILKKSASHVSLCDNAKVEPPKIIEFVRFIYLILDRGFLIRFWIIYADLAV
jgi:hypothetical protein